VWEWVDGDGQGGESSLLAHQHSKRHDRRQLQTPTVHQLQHTDTHRKGGVRRGREEERRPKERSDYKYEEV
jgi:hypothetical protein